MFGLKHLDAAVWRAFQGALNGEGVGGNGKGEVFSLKRVPSLLQTFRRQEGGGGVDAADGLGFCGIFSQPADGMADNIAGTSMIIRKRVGADKRRFGPVADGGIGNGRVICGDNDPVEQA